MIRALACLAVLTCGSPSVSQPVTVQDLSTLPPADIVVLGEVHDNPAHHDAQARVIAALRPAAVVWEMLTPEQVARLPGDLSDAKTVDMAVGWTSSGWPDFAMYHSLMLASPGAVHHGAGVPRDLARRAFDAPLAEVFGEGAEWFALNADLPEGEARERMADLMQSHCNGLPEGMLPGMLAAQRLRDATLARAAVSALQQTGGPVAVITGNGHARTDWGVPALLAQAAPDVRVVSVGMLEATPEREPPFDLWLVTPAHPRPDPCAAFR
jgi:uncharacterized iron-regulated protein